MSAPILATKLFIPRLKPGNVARLRLIDKLNEGLANGCPLTLISASAGFGKTTLVSQWIITCGRPAAWLALDAGDGDPSRFVSYLIAALQTIHPGVGGTLLAALQSPQPPFTEAILTALLNEISEISDPFILVLDDYHLVDSPAIDQLLTYLIEHQPAQMSLVIATREDPALPLAILLTSSTVNQISRVFRATRQIALQKPMRHVFQD